MANLVVEREQYTGKDEKQYWAYLVRGVMRGRNVKVDLQPRDKSDVGAYEILDIIFDIAPTAELVLHEEEMPSENGKPTKYTVYEVQNTDENGIVYSFKVKPRKDSDKAILAVLLMQEIKKVGADNENN